MYPPRYSRLHNFRRDSNAGIEMDPAKIDAELNAIQVTIDQLNSRQRAITTPTGALRFTDALREMDLVEEIQITATAGQTLFPVPVYTPATDRIRVFSNGIRLAPSQVTMTSTTSITIPARANGDIVVIEVFSQGAGALTQLSTVAAAAGAELVAIYDAGNLLDASNVEDALQEVAGSLSSFITALGSISSILRANGSVALAADLSAAGNTLTNLRDAVAAGEPVTLRQLAGFVETWNDLSRFFLKRDGSTAMAGNLNFGGNQGINLADPDPAQPLHAVNVRSLQRLVAATGGVTPIGGIQPYIGLEAPTGFLLCDGARYARDAYPILSALAGTYFNPPYDLGSSGELPTIGVTVNGSGGITGVTILSAGAGMVPSRPYTSIPLVDPRVTGGGSGGVISVGTNAAGQLVLNPTPIVSAGVDYVNTIFPPHLDYATMAGNGFFATFPGDFFCVPDLRGATLMGIGTWSKLPGALDFPALAKGDGYDAVPIQLGEQISRLFGARGEQAHRLILDEIPAHSHGVPRVNGGGSTRGVDDEDSPSLGRVGTITSDEEGGDLAHNNLPPFVGVNFIIKAQ